MWNDNSKDDLALLVAMVVVVVFILALTSGCATVGGPTSWRADQHVAAMEACRQACHPNGMAGWDSMSGTCTCVAPIAAVRK